MNDAELYAGREQTFVKHRVLETYLERFAHIIGSSCDTITYVDCFSGPWKVKSDRYEDSSFYIALDQLRKAKATHKGRGRDLQIRCYFIEENESAYEELTGFASKIRFAEVETLHSKCEQAIPSIVDFVRKGGAKSFPFIFIDPTGWTGFAMHKIAPLLQQRPGEVLIIFMTEHIRRFVESPTLATQDSIEALFGGDQARKVVQGLTGLDRDDAMVEAYAKSVREIGGFDHVLPTMILHPKKARTHYHLIYATRNPKGVEVFKQAEKKAMAAMESARADAEQKERQQKTGQSELFGSDMLHDTAHYDSLCPHHCRLAGIRRAHGRSFHSQGCEGRQRELVRVDLLML